MFNTLIIMTSWVDFTSFTDKWIYHQIRVHDPQLSWCYVPYTVGYQYNMQLHCTQSRYYFPCLCLYSCLVCILSTERWQVQFITSLLSMHVAVLGNRMNEMASWLNIQANLFCDMLKWDAPARLHTWAIIMIMTYHWYNISCISVLIPYSVLWD